ncbi:hypothetical protein D3C77_410230 [compost metagenome]
MKGPAISRYLDQVVDTMAIDIASAVYCLQHRPGKAQPYRGQVRLFQGLYPGLVAAQLHPFSELRVHRRNTGNVFLFNRATAPLPTNPGEIIVPSGIDQRRTVQVDVLCGRRLGKLTFAHRDKHFCHRNRAQAIWRLHRRLGFLFTAFAASDCRLFRCAHMFLQA